MNYIEDYEDNDLPDSTTPQELNVKYKALQSDLEFLLLKLKEFDNVVKEIVVDVKDLKVDIECGIISPSQYNLCKNEYVRLHRHFDNVRNNYDRYVEKRPNRLTG